MLTSRTTLGLFNRRYFLQLRWLLAVGLLFILLMIGGGLALRVLHPTAPVAIMPGQILAWDIARAVGRSSGVQIASGAYLPGDTLLLYSRVDQTDRTLVRAWALTQLEPFANRMASLGQNETLKWVIDFGAAPAEQEVLIAPLRRAGDPTLFRYLSAEPGLFANLSAGTTVSTTLPAAKSVPVVASAVVVSPPVIAAVVTPAVVAPALQSNAGSPLTTTVQTAAIPSQVTPLLDLKFDSGATTEWRPLSGDWAASNGIYSQRNKTGYDYISMLTLNPQAYYTMEARLRLVEGEMGGGFIYNAPDQTTRAGAQVIDMDQNGAFLRWGRYSDKGDYIYAGGVTIDPPLHDGQWHTLRLTTQAGNSIVALDGRAISQIVNTSPSGYLGLITSKAHVDFDNVNVIAQPPAGGMPMIVAAGNSITLTKSITNSVSVSNTFSRPISTTIEAITGTVGNTTNFADDFADGNADGWQVLNGTWQVIQQEYQQTGTDGFDLGSISTFQSDAYTISVRVRRIDGNMGAGLYFNMAQRTAKTRSQMINYTQNGKAVQWGHFDDGGNFVFEGSATVPDGSDGKWHTFGVTVKAGKASFTLDGQLLAKAVALKYKSGYVGLLTSKSRIAFDDVKIVIR